MKQISTTKSTLNRCGTERVVHDVENIFAERHRPPPPTIRPPLGELVSEMDPRISSSSCLKAGVYCPGRTGDTLRVVSALHEQNKVVTPSH